MAAARDPWAVRRLLAWGRRNRRSYPWRSEPDRFRVLVAELLLQRSRSSTVSEVYEELWRRWPTASALSGASEHDLREVIRPLGLVSRARTLKRLAAEVAARGLPTSVPDLEALPGVGRYAARAVTSARGGGAPLVDSVSARVYRRYFGLQPELSALVDADLWGLVDTVSPPTRVREWNWAVLDLAASVCLPRRPRCEGCPLVDRCTFARARRVGGGG